MEQNVLKEKKCVSVIPYSKTKTEGICPNKCM